MMRIPRHAPEVVAAGASAEESIDRAVTLLFAVIVADGQFSHAGHEFLDAAAGLDRGVIIRRASERLRERLRNKNKHSAATVVAMAETAFWNDVTRIFGWVDVARLEAQGSA